MGVGSGVHKCDAVRCCTWASCNSSDMKLHLRHLTSVAVAPYQLQSRCVDLMRAMGQVYEENVHARSGLALHVSVSLLVARVRTSVCNKRTSAQDTALFALLGGQVAVVSGTAGLRGAAERAERATRDHAAAAALRAGGADAFLDAWYRAPLWAPLRAHPRCTPWTLMPSDVPCGALRLAAGERVCQ